MRKDSLEVEIKEIESHLDWLYYLLDSEDFDEPKDPKTFCNTAELVGLYKKDALDFIDKLPESISWIKNISDKRIAVFEESGEDYYDSFFNIWSEMNHTPYLRELAKKAENTVYAVLLDGKPMYKHFENPLSYELSDDAKKIRGVACDIYDYVIWSQASDLFPEKTGIYCKKIYDRWIKPFVSKSGKGG